MIPSGPALAIVLAVAIAYFVGTEAVTGAKWVGHEASKVGHAIVHVFHHPKHDPPEDDETP